MKAAARLASWIDRISYVTGYISGVTVVLMALMLVVEVVMRSVFSRSTLMADEVSVYLFIAMLYFGLAYTLKSDRHIEIDIVTMRLSTRLRRYFARVISVFNVPVFMVLCWRAWVLVMDAYQMHEVAPTLLRTPIYLAKLPVALGMTVLLFQGAVEMVHKFTVKGADLKKGLSTEF